MHWLIYRFTMSLGMLLCLATAQAQSDISDTFKLEELYIQGDKYQTDVPLSLQEIDLSTLDRQHYGQNPVLLMERLSPSIQVETDGGSPFGNYAQFRLRGIAQARINFTLDGVPINDPLDHGTFFSNLADIGQNLSSIQILRGVAATRQGVPSFGGAVLMDGMRPLSSDLANSMTIQLASFGSLRASAQIAQRNPEQTEGIYARMSYLRSDGYIDHSGSESFSGYLASAKKWKKSLLSVTALVGKTQNQQAYLPVPLSVVKQAPKTNDNHPNDRDDFVQGIVSARYDYRWNSQARLQTTLYVGGAEGYFPFSISDTVQFNTGIQNRRIGLLSRLTGQLYGVDYQLGTHGYLFERENTEWISPNESNPYDRQKSFKRELTGFVSLQKAWGPWSVLASGQLRGLAIEFEQDPSLGTGVNHTRRHLFASTLLGLQYQFNSTSMAYLSHGYSQREPTKIDIFQGSAEEIQTDALQAEKLHNVELGFRTSKESWSLAINAFFMQFEDEIVSVGALQELTYFDLTRNVNQSRRMGLEGLASLDILPHLRLHVVGTWMHSTIQSVTLQDVELEDVKHILTPSINITPSLMYEITPQLEWQLGARIWSDSYTELSNQDEFKLPGNTVLFTSCRYSPSPKWIFDLRVQNLLDTEYYTDGLPVDIDFDGIIDELGVNIQAPRNFSVSVQRMF